MKATKTKAKRNKKLRIAEASLIEASYLYQQYQHSARCTKTPKEVFNIFNTLTSKASQYKYVKEQIMIRHLGQGWTEAHHPYSKAGYVYTPADLMEQFLKNVLPLAVTNTVPNEPPLETTVLPTQIVKATLSTKVDDFIALDTSKAKEDEDFRVASMRNRDKLEDFVGGDELQEL